MTASAWIRRFQPADDAGVRLICLPHAGGSATYYLPVAKALSPTVDVLALQYPGRQDRHNERCVDSMDELADLVAAELADWTDRPFAVFGHSLGATLGFEVTRRLEAAGTPPVMLFASGRRAPSRPRDERIHLRADDGLVAELRTLSGTDARILDNDEIVRMFLPALRADYKAVETYRYRPGPPLTCPIFTLVGDDDPKVTLDEARSWGEHTTGEFEFRAFRGGHFYLDAHAREVIDLISARLTAAVTAGTAPGPRRVAP
ncbi:MAG TPA: alpha/beta fold hydrolase [Amycolatopsis sp.]|nr:alpha/beta fold hydrolase [Amycolatopsis sp.]